MINTPVAHQIAPQMLYDNDNDDVYISFNIVKGSIFLKNRHFIIQERFNKLIYGITTTMKYGTWQPVKLQFVSRSWNEMIFLSYLWINVANINSEIQ